MKKPAAGAARILIFYSSPPFETPKSATRGGSVAKPWDSLNSFYEIILPLNSHEKQLPSKVLSEDHRKFHQLAIGSEPSSAFSTFLARLALISVSNPRGSAYSCEGTDRLPAFSNESSKTIDLQSQIVKKSYQ